jgi:dihydroxyacetone kinase-like predicted kinase
MSPFNGTDFTAMVLAGAEQLQQHAEHVNSLNVFPVPDGDTEQLRQDNP